MSIRVLTSIALQNYQQLPQSRASTQGAHHLLDEMTSLSLSSELTRASLFGRGGFIMVKTA